LTPEQAASQQGQSPGPGSGTIPGGGGGDIHYGQVNIQDFHAGEQTPNQIAGALAAQQSAANNSNGIGGR
jgi:hypothetical protein